VSGCGGSSGNNPSLAPTFSFATPTPFADGRQLFNQNAVENANFTQVTLPINQGTSGGDTVFYIVTDSSDQQDALQRGVNFAPKLAKAVGTDAVMPVTVNSSGIIDFPATVTFGETHVLVAGSPNAFPPAQAAPGSTGNTGYSPLIQLPNGVVLNASQIANSTGHTDKALSVDTTHLTVVWGERQGFFNNRVCHYISTDASATIPAAVEDVTLAANLGDAPTQGDESPASSRETIVAVTNGQTGATNPQRQGLDSAILDGLNPLNIVDETPPTTNGPGSTAYSPLWDVNLATWSDTAVTNGQNTRQTSVAAVRTLAQQGTITAPGGGTFGANGLVVDCPLISLDAVP
jgi:hypothetical protein